jgi:lipoate-protein ligase A
MITWRLLNPKTSDGYTNMAIDEAILLARIKGVVPNTLRFYRWNPSAVSVGRFQNVESEVQLDTCKSQNVDVVRRMTGGGTVYHDSRDEITYSVVASTQDLGTTDIGSLYAKLYVGLAEALRILGVKSDFNAGTLRACPNLTVQGRKISGSAQTHRAGVVLQHGTLLLNVNFERMFAFLRVPPARTRTEVINVARDRITSINAELRKRVSVEEVTTSLTEGFSLALYIRPVEAEMTRYELDLATKLKMEKYGKDEWNLTGNSLLA